MSTKNIIALAFSDLHLHKFSKFNDLNKGRLQTSLDVATYIGGIADQLAVPILFAGDLFHDPKELENEVITKTKIMFKKVFDERRTPFYSIPGNHDMSQKNTLKNISPHYLEGFRIFKGFHDLTDPEGSMIHKWGDYLVAGIPFMNYEGELIEAIKKLSKKVKSINRKKILLLHGNAPKAKTTTGHIIDDCRLPEELDKFFKHWDLVLFGHIHLPQQLSKKCYMLGSPIQQNIGDEGIEMGYWEVYDDMTCKLIPLNNIFPEFLTFNNGNDYANYCNEVMPLKKYRDYTSIEVDRIDVEDEAPKNSNFSAKTNRGKLSKRYCKTRGITDKNKINALKKILQDT